jgi:hypothetical protein
MALSLTLQIRAVYARACEAPKDEKQNMKCPVNDETQGRMSQLRFYIYIVLVSVSAGADL